jgi:hypothetical protein
MGGIAFLKPMKTKILVSALIVLAACYLFADARRAMAKSCRVRFGSGGTTEVLLEIKEKRLFITGRAGTTKIEEQVELDHGMFANKPIRIAESNGSAVYTIKGVSTGVFQDGGDYMMVSAQIQEGKIDYEQYGSVRWNKKGEIPVVHFHGPLKIEYRDIVAGNSIASNFVHGGPAVEVRALVGTIDPKVGCWTVVRSGLGKKYAFPEGICPTVDIEFPSKKAGESGPKQRYSLKEFC